MNATCNYFKLFDLPVAFVLDPARLDEAYRSVQRQVHPDRFAGASDAERRLAMQRATLANEAYATLRQPLARALHILALRGVDANAGGGARMQPGFLARQLEWREAVAQARAARDAAALERLQQELQGEKDGRYEGLGGLLGGRQDEQAAEAARELMFIEKLEAEIGDGIEALEAG
ncbi:MAG: Fe-S protein assembly co-chaperone HscB [Burkholderiales bacterium]|nr:Fe-S protein assembly co-chaperone HscB [Burkholderiales bacterium]